MMRAAKESFHANGGQINKAHVEAVATYVEEERDKLLEEKVSIETTDELEKLQAELADRVGVSIESIREHLQADFAELVGASTWEGAHPTWSAAEEGKLLAAVRTVFPERPDRWRTIAATVGGGKTEEECEDHALAMLKAVMEHQQHGTNTLDQARSERLLQIAKLLRDHIAGSTSFDEDHDVEVDRFWAIDLRNRHADGRKTKRKRLWAISSPTLTLWALFTR